MVHFSTKEEILRSIEFMKKRIETYDEEIKKAQELKSNATTSREKLLCEKLEERLKHEQGYEKYCLEQRAIYLEKFDPIQGQKIQESIDKIEKAHSEKIKNMNDEKFYQSIDELMESAQEKFNNSVLKDFILPQLLEILKGRRLVCIRAIGIGTLYRFNPCFTTTSALQLTLVLFIKQHFPEAIVTYQELEVHEIETKWLASKGITVLPTSDLKTIPHEYVFEDENAVTLCVKIGLCYFHHENVLLSYWSLNKMRNFIEISNDYCWGAHKGTVMEPYWEELSEKLSFPKLENCNSFKKCDRQHGREDENTACVSNAFCYGHLYFTWLKSDVEELPEVVEFQGKHLVIGDIRNKENIKK